MTRSKKAYETGKGRVVVRSKTEIEKLKGGKEQIVITEIPYEINKANLVKKIDEVRVNNKVAGIAEVRDESDRDGLRIAIELKKDANTELVLNYLFKYTDCKSTTTLIWWLLTISPLVRLELCPSYRVILPTVVKSSWHVLALTRKRLKNVSI